ncbi:hypothetical protein Tco_1246652 [Tanacetum coccineum]
MFLDDGSQNDVGASIVWDGCPNSSSKWDSKIISGVEQTVTSFSAKMKVIKEESEVLGLLIIVDDLFTCGTPLQTIFNEFNRLSGMDDDLFAYEVKIPEPFYFLSIEKRMDDLDNGDLDVYERKVCYDECEKIYAEAVIFINKRLVRLIDVTVEQWLDLKYGDHTMVINEKEVYGLDADMEYDPSNVDFGKWLASKFSNHDTMDWYTKNALWIYWTRGDDDEVMTDDGLSNSRVRNFIEKNKIVEIFRIETDIFQFETPLCEAFKEFNYLLKIDVDVLTNDIPGFKNCDEYKDAWIYEWNKDVPWVASMLWLDYGPWMEPSDDIEHVCKLFCFKNRHAKCWKKEKYCNGGDLPRVIRARDMIYFKSYEWYENLENGELKDEALNSKAIFEGSKGGR